MSNADIGLLVFIEAVFGFFCALIGSLTLDSYWEYRREIAQKQHALEMKKVEIEMKKIEVYSERGQ